MVSAVTSLVLVCVLLNVAVLARPLSLLASECAYFTMPHRRRQRLERSGLRKRQPKGSPLKRPFGKRENERRLQASIGEGDCDESDTNG